MSGVVAGREGILREAGGELEEGNSMDEHELLPGVRVDVAAVVWDYCEQDRLAYLYFDFIDPGTGANEIAPADIWIANNLNGRIQLGEFAAIWKRAEERMSDISGGLEGIEKDAALWEADEDTLRRAGLLLDILCGPRAYGARITKILHKKRPDLFPIIDSRVLPLFEGVVPSVKGRSWSDYMVELARVVGPWIERNAQALDDARGPFIRHITRLRAYDICLWKYAASIT